VKPRNVEVLIGVCEIRESAKLWNICRLVDKFYNREVKVWKAKLLEYSNKWLAIIIILLILDINNGFKFKHIFNHYK
jgi:hypothetical protein